MGMPNVTLMCNSRVLRLLTSPTGGEITAVEVQHAGEASPARYFAGFFAVCAGAINSAVILLQSANATHPRGLANSSDQVGRNFMFHAADAVLAISTHENTDSYTKTWGTNDWYLKDSDAAYPYPLGQIQPIGSFHHEMMKAQAPPLTPGFVLEAMKHRAVPWWLTTEDLPDPNNRVTIANATPNSVPASLDSPTPGLTGPHPANDTGITNQSATVSIAAPKHIRLSYTPNNVKSFKRLKDRWIDVLSKAGHATGHINLDAYFKQRIPLEGVGHQKRHLPHGPRPRHLSPGPQLQGPRPRQPLRRRRLLLCIRLRRQPVADDHRQRYPRRRTPAS